MKISTRQGRRAALAKIHIAKKQLNLDEDTYRAMLQEVAGVDSAADLDQRGLGKVLDRLADRGAKFTSRGRTSEKSTPHQPKRRLLWKIYQLLGDRPVKYAVGILKHMGGPRRPGVGLPPSSSTRWLRLSSTTASARPGGRQGRRAQSTWACCSMPSWR